jgi:hypothetical protein
VKKRRKIAWKKYTIKKAPRGVRKIDDGACVDERGLLSEVWQALPKT